MSSSSWGSLVIIVGVVICWQLSCASESDKSVRSLKNRRRSSSWHVVVSFTQSQTAHGRIIHAATNYKNDIQTAWEKTRADASLTDIELTYVEARETPVTDSLSYPLSLLNQFCEDIENGKTILNIVIGGGPAARFLVSAASSINIPTLWLPFTYRDFLQQGQRARFESRLGSSPEQLGSAAAALMHKANWHAFTLFIDTTLLPVHHLLKTHRMNLTPKTIIHLPTNDKTLRLRLRRLSEEGGSGGVLLIACDLYNARRIIKTAGKYEMLTGRFLWLWLDLKEELRSNEPNLIDSQLIHGTSRVGITTNDNLPPLETIERNVNLVPDNEINLDLLPNLASDIQRLHEYRWASEMIVKRKRQDKFINFDVDNNNNNNNYNNNNNNNENDERDKTFDKKLNSKNFMPVGMLALTPSSLHLTSGDDTRGSLRRLMSGEDILPSMLRATSQALEESIAQLKPKFSRVHDSQLKDYFIPKCLAQNQAKFIFNEFRENMSRILTSKLRDSMEEISRNKAEFQLLNLQGVTFAGNRTLLKWTKVGNIKGGKSVRLDTIIWPGGGIVPAYLEQGGEKIGMPLYRIVTALAPPFTMATNLQEGQCLRGVTCHQGEIIKCCYGFTIDLLAQMSKELEFRFNLYIVKDGYFGRKLGRDGTWNGVIGELVTGHAQLAFAPLSVSKRRAEVVDFTTPYFYSGVSFLSAPKHRSEIPLLAFLQPFSPQLWIAVFTSLHITAFSVGIFEWYSPFGLNPWGRNRSKNFSISSALWVMWGLLCGHLVAFKAPKSWPNKFLINVWGGFSVIFVASYTANIAALIAGLFFHSSVTTHRSLLSQRVGVPKASAAEYYVQQYHKELWSHIIKYSLSDVAEGVERLRNGSLDILIADTPILDYYRGTDNGCSLQKNGDTIMNADTYAIALSKGHPLTETISKVIANYTSNGFLDILQEKWYGGLPCMRDGGLGIDREQGGQPRPLGVESVAGVFCLLGLGMLLGTIILAAEHLFYKYTLPRLRHRPKTSMWRNRNVMFFSQKLYRFINCVELVSPHHAARELVHTVRQGQITSLFQKSVKRKEYEQRRRRKSKAQFFEMIQEIRRVQQEEKVDAAPKEEMQRAAKKEEKQGRDRSRSKSPLMLRSPKRSEKCTSSTNLSSSRLGLSPISLDTMKPREFTLSSTNLRARSPLETVGRRLSHGEGDSPPPYPGSNFGGSANLRPIAPPRGESLSGASTQPPKYSRSPAKRGQSFPAFATLRTPQSTHHQPSSCKSPLLSPNSELTSIIGRKLSREWGSGILDITRSSEAIGSCSTFTLNHETNLIPGESSRRKKSQEDILSLKKPIRRARSHENKDTGKSLSDLQSPRLNAQPVVGGKLVNERTKKQLESELKAILTARAHHRELLDPP
ncbi:uncharacterized protein LOC122511745 isoform X3 [Leptopilina heterotoma]|uniref:uncharacterized protein LOC122511745 isoform X3 n=1 Tax=Leptopilina heterotoma TaxID=63436 RepID=UPI001CA867AB|nr:uncharacterized protein LOC122511745 isoform X3 [Leptopilina heterotoma]